MLYLGPKIQSNIFNSNVCMLKDKQRKDFINKRDNWLVYQSIILYPLGHLKKCLKCIRSPTNSYYMNK